MRTNKNNKLAVSPEGWKGTVEEMKKNKDIDNPWALAWSMKDKGYTPHVKEPKRRKSKLLSKRALDAVNEELAKPTYDPRKDFDRHDDPFFYRGVEDHNIAPDPKTSDYKKMPKEFSGSPEELGQLALKNGYFRARGNAHNISFLKRIEDSNYDYEIYYKKIDGVWKMQGGEVRVKYEFAPGIESFIRKTFGKTSEIKQHKAPTKLPPRDENRSRMDQDVKKELDKDPDLVKESSKRKSIRSKG